MTRMSRFLLRTASLIAGRDRTDWIDAMSAETYSAGGESTAWAAGCVRAAIKDRLRRDWRFILAILLLPITAYPLQLLVFFPTVWLSRQAGLPNWAFIIVVAFVPIFMAFLIGRLRPGCMAYLAVPISFVIWVMTPLLVSWISFGDSPWSWFGSNATWFMMPPLLGLTCALVVWLAGVWIGSHSRRAPA
jgi:hypothetical protein